MKNEAILSNDRLFTSPRLERYTKIVEWDNGYIVVMAKYEGCEEEEEYFDVDDFLKPAWMI